MILDGEAELAGALTDWGLPMDEDRWKLLRAFAASVLEAGARANLTADLEPRKILLRHLADGFAAAAVLKSLDPAPAKVADLGAGAGFVGFAVKLALPGAEVVWIEPLEKRFAFLNSAAAASRLPGLKVARRSPGSWKYDAVLVRAVAPLPEALALAAPMTAPGGRILIFQSQTPDPAQAALARALGKTRAVPEPARSYRLPGEDKDRFFAVFRVSGD